MGSAIPTAWLWFCLIGLQVMNDHSGYHFPLSFSPEFHHLKFHTSYGWLGVTDWLHGTDSQFTSQRFTTRGTSGFTPRSLPGSCSLITWKRRLSKGLAVIIRKNKTKV